MLSQKVDTKNCILVYDMMSTFFVFGTRERQTRESGQNWEIFSLISNISDDNNNKMSC